MLDVRNNIVYDFYNGTGQDFPFKIGYVANPGATNYWTVNYDDYRIPPTELSDWFCWSTNSFCNYQGGFAEIQSLGMEANGIVTNPAFASVAFGCTTNSAGNNYHLSSGSPCIGAGANLSSLNLPGLVGSTNGGWDIGAYQH